MKELSIEEKARRYDEAIEIAKNEYQTHESFNGFCEMLAHIFPELKESKDEMIREAIGYAIGQSTHSDSTLINGVSSEEALAWLEKQGQKEYALKSFKDEDVRKFMQCIEKQAKAYEFNLPNRGYDVYAFAKDLLVWLEEQNGQKPVIEMKTPEESLGIDSDTYNKIVDECIYGEQKPANKVEPKFKIGDNIEPIDSCLGSPLTIYKICDGFYETNQGTLDFELENNWRLIEQKPACSEEDEVKINRIVACLENLIVADNDILLKDVDWLKSLRPQNRWKPSDEQLYWLKWTVNRMPDTEKANEAEAVLEDLLEQLKKLK